MNIVLIFSNILFSIFFYIYYNSISTYKILKFFEQLIGRKNKNMLRTIWASNWPKIKNVEAQNFRCSYKNVWILILKTNIIINHTLSPRLDGLGVSK